MFLLRNICLISILFISLCNISIIKGNEDATAAQEDSIEDDTSVENEEKGDTPSGGAVSDMEQPSGSAPPQSDILVADTQDDDGLLDGYPKAHPDVSATLVFTDPALGAKTTGEGLELPAGQQVNVLVGFTLKGSSSSDSAASKEVTLTAIDAAFRYPQDYSYYLQNFTIVRFVQSIDPKMEASVAYSFVPAIQLAGRPFGLTVRVFYQDAEGKPYVSAAFNDTVNLVEFDDGFDTEAFFLYVLIVAVLVILCVVIYHLASSGRSKSGRKRTGVLSGSGRDRPAEMGTTGKNDVDFDWIPKEHIELQNRKSPGTSPRQRKTNRQEARGDD